jgi:hypothetical protein
MIWGLGTTNFEDSKPFLNLALNVITVVSGYDFDE